MIKKDRNGTELQYAQLCGCAGSPRRKAGGKIISALALVMMLVLIRQLRTIRYLQKNEDIRCGSEDGKPLSIPLREHFHADFIIGAAFLALCWIMS